MTPEQLRAHGLLNGQTLLPEWVPVAKLYAEATKRYAEGDKLYAEAHKLWRTAVRKEFGTSMTIDWTADGCRLGNGEVYRYDN